MTGMDGPGRIDGEPAGSTERIPAAAPGSGRRTSRAAVALLGLGLLCSLAAVAVGLYGAAELATSAISAAAVRGTAAAGDRDRAQATQARQTQTARQTTSTRGAAATGAEPDAPASPVAGQEPPAGWKLAFSETFDGSASRWLLLDETHAYATHKSEIVDGAYRWETEAHRDFASWVYPDSEQTSDFHVTVQGRRVSGTTSGEYGLAFRVQEEWYYRFVISDLGRFTVEKYFAGRWADLISSRISTEIRPDQTNALTVTASGDRFTFHINGQYVGEAADDQLESGHIGLAIGLKEAGDIAVFEFDDFQIWAPP